MPALAVTLAIGILLGAFGAGAVAPVRAQDAGADRQTRALEELARQARRQADALDRLSRTK